MKRPVRIANASGFYGDRVDAMREVIEGGPVDVVTGDYLAELTMLILWKAKRKNPEAGYARTFLTQLEQVLGTALDRGVKIVANAGGLNPSGLAASITGLAEGLGLAPKVAWIDGDDLSGRMDELFAAGHDLTHLDTGRPLRGSGVIPVTANAYLGGWGITAALDAGADVVVTGRVTDASLVTGAAAWWHGWERGDYDALAGAVAAGHVIECGPQATGGNYGPPSKTPPSKTQRSQEQPSTAQPPEIAAPGRLGYPIAEVAADGSSVITKHPGTGGFVSAGTVTSQLLYEIGDPAYANPDVTAHFDTCQLSVDGPDRIRISGTRGTAPPGKLKVAINYTGGYRNTMTLVLTGLDIESKAAAAEAQLFDALGGKERFDDVDVRLLRFDRPDAATNAEATAHLRITVKSGDRALAGRTFSGAAVELYLGGYAGFHTTTPPTDASEFGVYWPALIDADAVPHTVHFPDGKTVFPKGAAPPFDPRDGGLLAPRAPSGRPSQTPLRSPVPEAAASGPSGEASGPPLRERVTSPGAPSGEACGPPLREGVTSSRAPSGGASGPPLREGATSRGVSHGGSGPVRAPLGLVCGARSGDKGGNANVGLWTRRDDEYAWLRSYLTEDRFKELLPEAADLPVRRYELPNLRALNFVVVGLLGDGVASSARPDPQAKGLGEYVRSRHVDLPGELTR